MFGSSAVTATGLPGVGGVGTLPSALKALPLKPRRVRVSSSLQSSASGSVQTPSSLVTALQNPLLQSAAFMHWWQSSTLPAGVPGMPAPPPVLESSLSSPVEQPATTTGVTSPSASRKAPLRVKERSMGQLKTTSFGRRQAFERAPRLESNRVGNGRDGRY